MPREREEAWHEVGRHAAELGSQLREPYRAQQGADTSMPPIESALEAMSRQARIALEATAQALRDQQVRDQALRTSRAIADAVEVSVASLSGEVKQARKRAPKRRDRQGLAGGRLDAWPGRVASGSDAIPAPLAPDVAGPPDGARTDEPSAAGHPRGVGRTPLGRTGWAARERRER